MAESSDGWSEREDSFIENTPVTWKYEFMWAKTSLQAPQYKSPKWSDGIESVNCTSDEICTAALPGIEVALEYDSDIPSIPFCDIPDDASNATTPGDVIGKCTCGRNRCVSRSRDSKTDNIFYYCGPCGYVGSRCTNHQCSHKLAECREGYCECIQGGTFYDMAYCYIPFFGQQVLINVLIATSILLLCCATLAYGYHKLGNRRLRRGSFYNERGSSTGRREAPSHDTPPAYDDVMEKLPSYQDAIQMLEKGEGDKGLNNPAFEEEESKIQKSKTDEEDSTTMVAATLQGEAEGQNNAVFKDMTSPPKYQDSTTATHSTSLASSALVSPSTSLTPNEDIASFPEGSAQLHSDPELPDMNEQQGIGTQPIELLLHDALHTHISTTSL